MRAIVLTAGLLLVTAPNGFGQTTAGLSMVSARPAGPRLARVTASNATFLADNCLICHSDSEKVGNLSLEKVDITRAAQHAETLEKVILKLKAGMMPPPEMPKLDPAVVQSFVKDIETRIDQAAAVRPNPGRPILHRLNRTEYANSIRDLLGVDINVQSMLPPDDMSEGYDNMSDVLTISPALLDGYMTAAGKISRLAVGDLTAAPIVETYVVPQAFSQLKHIEGAPLGTRGGTVFTHNFPADAEYSFILTFYYASIGGFFGDNKPADGEQIEISIDGERVALLDVSRRLKVDDDLRTPPIRIKAGPHTVAAAFLERISGPVQDFVSPFEQALADLSTGHIAGLTGLPHLRNVGIKGPENITGVSEMPSHQKIFVCRPAVPTEESTCANRIMGSLARKAFRRPVTDRDLKHLRSLYETGRKERDFKYGITLALQAILADPEFIFRFERTPAGVAPGTNHHVSDLELASRLSFFLWSSSPDDELLRVAGEGRLKNPAILEQQVRRMLADPRSESLAESFASHWLHLQNLKDAHPDVYLYPNWDYNLSQSMLRETHMLFNHIVREDRSLTELLTADYTFVDGRLAKHYGIPNILGNRFRKVQIPDRNRRGLLGHSSILTLTSLANRTSPVIRGQWILSVFMGAPPPNPPANIPPLKENEEGVKALSVRERLEEHRKNPACASCHNVMDPIGYSLENFDPTGAWRVKDSGDVVDPSGKFYDGTSVDGPAGLRDFLKKHESLFVTNFTRNMLMFALGRVLQPYDMPAVRSIVNEAGRSGNRFSSFVMGIVKSTPFQMRRADEAPTNDQVAGPREN